MTFPLIIFETLQTGKHCLVEMSCSNDQSNAKERHFLDLVIVTFQKSDQFFQYLLAASAVAVETYHHPLLPQTSSPAVFCQKLVKTKMRSGAFPQEHLGKRTENYVAGTTQHKCSVPLTRQGRANRSQIGSEKRRRPRRCCDPMGNLG